MSEAAAAAPAPGDRLGDRWTLEAKIGAGGMGTVWRARDDEGRAAAVKILRAEFMDTEDLFARFEQEAKAASRIGNEHIVEVYEFGTTPSGQPFYAMEFCDGPDLLAVLEREGPLPWRRVFALGEQICAALQDAHDEGIIHRDVKPENFVLVEREEREGRDFLKVLDFGIAKLTDPDLSAIETRTGVSVGTPEYMSPEQGEGLVELDGRVDVYGVGVLLYQLMCGRVPFEGEDEFEVMQRHMSEVPEPPSALAPAAAIPTLADAVILQALEKDREHRFADMRRFARSLRSAASQDDAELTSGSSARSERAGESVGGKLSRLAVILIALLVVAVGVVIAASL